MRITIVGGGSAQWVPILADDVAITPSLADCELVLHDIDPARAARTAAYARHISTIANAGIQVTSTPELGEALDGARYVIVCISTGGLDSMSRDLEVSARFGVPMPVGDTSGPAGISRALRNVPILLEIARTMEVRCPDAWLINVTNPLTALTRVVSRETSIKVVGLCHELGACRFFVSQMLDADFFDVELRVTGVNHFPLVVGIDVAGRDRFTDLLDVAHERIDLDRPLPFLDKVMAQPVATTGGTPSDAMRAPGWTKRRLREMQVLNYELLRSFGALPGADRNHTIEFVPGFIAEGSAWAERWGIEPTTIEERRGREVRYQRELDERMARTRPPTRRSTELVIDVIDALETGAPFQGPMNIANAGQCPDLPDGAIVESICIADGAGIRGRDRVTAPPALGALLRRIVAAQESTVDAAIAGDRDILLHALFTDPLAGALDHDALVALRDEIIASTAEWLPQFA